ncbi:unnamed protein product [Caenorhabditis angaria]|uniref:Histone-lysine N-methyltransferase, H3 lysine-79 specific n=1 Tax=Caenorhabditis angaria TaxID=860376 RepID=A0A9P1IUX0_9PELO|nr:unnamed protein product [Caenorhabditis angaria]
MDSSIKKPSSTNSQNPSTSLATPKSAVSISVNPVIYKSSTLKLSISPNQQFLYGVILRIIKTVYASRIPQITSELPEDWEKIKENDVKRIGELIIENRKMLGEWALPFCTQQIAAQITNWAYNCAVSTPSILNSHYKSFSSETYGETNLEQITSILNELQLGPDDVFVDLGSGVGQLVVYTAACTKIKKAVGIELSTVPANHAQNLQHYYKNIMGHFGKSYSPFELHNGDFLDAKFRDLITKEATVIFINNYAFSPDLLVKISDELISELNDNVRIVTAKEMGVLKREVNDRTSRDISSILEMRQMKSLSNGVSWTANVVKFWLHTVDKSKVFKFFEQKANRPKGKDSKSSSSQMKEKEGKMQFSTPKEEKINLKRLAPTPSDYDNDKYFFGRTKRRMCKAQVGGYKKPKENNNVLDCLGICQKLSHVHFSADFLVFVEFVGHVAVSIRIFWWSKPCSNRCAPGAPFTSSLR